METKRASSSVKLLLIWVVFISLNYIAAAAVCGNTGHDCSGNGKCNDATGKYLCDCYDGYYGGICERNCLKDACKNHNNTFCVITGTMAACKCNDSFVSISDKPEKSGCRKDVCNPNNCRNGAVCVEKKTSSVIQYDAICLCNSTTFFGPICNDTCETYCEQDKNLTCSTNFTDEDKFIPQCKCKDDQYTQINNSDISKGCHIDLCKNLRPCDDCKRMSDTDYHCKCKNGTYGKHCTESCNDVCENSTMECHLDENDITNNATCVCLEGHGGENCELSCNDLCGANSTNCNISSDGSYFCECSSNFTGKNCTIKCEDKCGGNSKCEYNSSSGAILCHCLEGYRLVGKDKKICVADLCATNDGFCENGGECFLNESGEQECNCTSKFTGKKCDCPADVCSNDNKCSGGRTCVPVGNCAQCQCSNSNEIWDGSKCNSNETNGGCVNCTDYEQCKNSSCECKFGHKQADGSCGKNFDACLVVQCPLNSICENKEPSYKCHCNDTYFSKKPNVTDNTVECEKIASTETCKIIGKIFNDSTNACQCPEHFENDKDGCKPQSPCETDNCGNNFICFNDTIVNSTGCFCKPGYEENSTGNGCVDIDECANDYFSSTCQPLGSCVNTNGSYKCDCGNNRYDEPSKTCQLLEDKCKNGATECDSISTVCVQQDTEIKCKCAGGYEVIPENSTHCQMRAKCNEDQITQCGEKAQCEINPSTPGPDKSVCICPPAQFHNGNYCELANYAYPGEIRLNESYGEELKYPESKRYQELKYLVDNKLPELFRTYVSITIQVTGFRDGSVIVMYDLLSNIELNNAYMQNITKQICNDTQLHNYTNGGLNLNCEFDEMNIVNNNSGCATLVVRNLCPTNESTCTPNVGGKPYVCSCKEGFEEVYVDGMYVRCNDINECKIGNHCTLEQQECINTPGSFICKCKLGYILKDNKCQGICSDNPCKNSGKCQINGQTDYNCECERGFTGRHCEVLPKNIAENDNTVWEIIVGVLAATLIVAIIISVIVIRRLKNKTKSHADSFFERRDAAEASGVENQYDEMQK